MKMKFYTAVRNETQGTEIGSTTLEGLKQAIMDTWPMHGAEWTGPHYKDSGRGSGYFTCKMRVASMDVDFTYHCVEMK